MKITYSKGRGTKIHISIDGEYRLTTDADFWFSCGYRSGDEITPEQFKELSEDICYRKAFNKAVDYLSRRDHSVRELTDKLGRSFEHCVCDRVVNDLTERGYLDDTNFARNYARYLCESKHFWTARIKNELYKKGIDRVIIDDVIYGVIDIAKIDNLEKAPPEIVFTSPASVLVDLESCSANWAESTPGTTM